jgi:hypothetical protein
MVSNWPDIHAGMRPLRVQKMSLIRLLPAGQRKGSSSPNISNYKMETGGHQEAASK